MRVATGSIVVGGSACPFHCPFCVSKQTPAAGVEPKPGPVNWNRFLVFKRLLKTLSVPTVLLTGKGEPTLWPDLVDAYLRKLGGEVPFVELQTSGVLIAQNYRGYYDGTSDGRPYYLEFWAMNGLTTVAVSVVHHEDARNREIYDPSGDYMSLPRLIDMLHEAGLSVRLTAVMMAGYLETVEDVEAFLWFAKARGVEQVMLRPIAATDAPADRAGASVADWTRAHRPVVRADVLSREEAHEEWMSGIDTWFAENATRLRTLPHGAEVYDWRGQNVCFSNCLTDHADSDDLRQVIFFPDGSIRHDWRYEGARLL